MGVALTVGVVGVVILFHAAYSTIQYRGLLKITEEEFSGPPFNVVIELFSGLLLCFWAALTAPGKFLSIHPQSEENRIVSLPANLDFMIFNHRRKVFPVEMDVNGCEAETMRTTESSSFIPHMKRKTFTL